MIKIQLIKELVEKALEGTDKYLVNISVSPDNRIYIYLDSDTELTINDCTGISRFIESNLDRNTEDFELQVSSYGLDKGFKLKRQYLKNIGKEVQVIEKSGEKKQGKLVYVDENGIEIEVINKTDKKTKKTEKSKLKLLFDDIKETKPIVSFKK